MDSNGLYKRRKAHEFSLMIFYFIVLALGVNNFSTTGSPPVSTSQNNFGQFIVHKSSKKNERKIQNRIKSVFKEKVKTIKKYLRNTLKKWKGPKNQNFMRGLLGLLLMGLIVSVAILLGYHIAGLACYLSCTGHPVLAAVASILGWGGILWLSIISIKGVFQRILRRENKPSSSIKPLEGG